jgi:hypothetical protein
MSDIKPKPVTIEDAIVKLQEIMAEHGNMEIRNYEGRHAISPTWSTYPTFSVMPADHFPHKIVVIL